MSKESGNLYQRDSILLSAWGQTVFRLSRSAQTLADKLGVSKTASSSDRFLDFVSEIRDRQPIMSRYIDWLYEVQRLYSGPNKGGEKELARLADTVRPRFFKMSFPKPEKRAQHLSISRKLTLLELEDVEKRFVILMNMSKRTRSEFEQLVRKQQVGGYTPAKSVLNAMKEQRKVITNIFLLSREMASDFNYVRKLQQVAGMDADYNFPKDFKFSPTSDIEMDMKLQSEQEIRPRVLRALEDFMDLKAPPDSFDFWDQLIESVTVD